MAVTISARELADRVQGVAASAQADLPGSTASHLLAVATAMVEQYGPAAPEAIANEAVVRFAGYLAQSDFGTIVKESIGPRDVEYTVNHAAMFRNSGAAALLSPWRVRHAGVIG